MSLLLLLLVLASIATLVTVSIFFAIGRHRRAGRVLIGWGIGVAAYSGILVAMAMRPHDMALAARVPFCDDDMCGSIERVTKTPAASGEVTYRLGFRLFSQANHGLRSAKGAAIYLSDERDRRFLPIRLVSIEDPSAIPFDVAIQPGQSVSTALTFNVPSDVRRLFFNAGVNGIQYASFVIGNGDLLHNPRIRLRIE